MDVTCPRCQTDYEFDDALVSERGTTVKCTNCGHQFRVFRARGGGATTTSPELWRIERRQGEPLELRSLVELQRAIRAGRVSRDDLLRRGDGPARRVGDIPELEPFFPTPRADSAPSTLPLGGAAAGSGAKTSAGVGLATPPVVTEGPRVPAHTPAYGANRPPSVPPPPPPTAVGSQRPAAGVAPPPPRITDRPLAPARLPTPLGLAPPPVAPPDQPHAGPPPAEPRPAQSAPPPRTAPIPPPPRTGDPELEPPTIRRTDMRVSAQAAAPPVRASDAVTQSVPPRPIDSVTQSVPPPRGESYESLFPTRPKRRSGAGWLVALVLLGGLVALGATVGRPYLEKLAGRGASPTASSPGSDRLQGELAVGERARNDGDWAGAREAYLRATVIDEKSLVAWDGLCTAESELAMAHWIAALATRSALERDQAASIGASAAKSCARWSELERAASSEGAKKVAGDMRPVRAVATQGDGSGVRVYLPVHPGDPFVEALAYLADVPKGDHAALDKASKSAAGSLARAEIDKLTTSSELALVAYGAAVTGNATRHGAALAELARRAPRDPLLETLRGLVGGDAGPVPHDAAVAAVDAGGTDAKTTVAVVGTGGTAPTAATGAEPPAAGGDYRSLNEKGHKALASGEVSKAEAYFKGALAQHPGDVDALYGLGQIARSRGDHAGAISYFKQVLDTSAGFAPARLALADEQWAVGDKAAAAKNYELYLERVSEGSGADRARARLGKSTDTKIEPKQGDPKPEEAP